MEQPVKRIADYVVNDVVTAFFAVRRADVREFTRGQYLRVELGDCTGRIPGVWWDPDHFGLTDLTEGMVVKARGTVTEYNNKLQITIDKLRLAKDDEYAVEDILPHSKNSYDDRKQRILKLTDKIENSYTRALAMSFWEDESFLHDFLMAAAGKLWHHAYVGGLADHSANIAELTQRVAQGYDFLDRDLLLFGGIFHDAGKVDTYRGKTVIDYTDEGRLVGHICLCDHWIAERASKIEAFPDKLLVKLRHMILAHQGELQYATPVVPQIPEAFVLYYCDEIDSKMGAIERIRDKQGGVGWSEYINLLGRHLYFGDEPTTE